MIRNGITTVNWEALYPYNRRMEHGQGASIPGWYTYAGDGVYLNSNGEEVSFDEVFNNYVLPNAINLPTNINLSSIEFVTQNGESGVWFTTITWGPLKRMEGEAFAVSTEAKITSSFLSFSSNGGTYSNGEGEAGEGESADDGISSQEATYGITALGLSITGKTELFRVLEGSKNLPKYFKGSSKLGMRLGFVGLGVTTIDGFTNPNGWQKHHTADLVIQGGMLAIATFLPGVGWVVAVGYFAGDLVFQHYHNGQSMTEYYFDKP